MKLSIDKDKDGRLKIVITAETEFEREYMGTVEFFDYGISTPEVYTNFSCDYVRGEMVLKELPHPRNELA